MPVNSQIFIILLFLNLMFATLMFLAPATPELTAVEKCLDKYDESAFPATRAFDRIDMLPNKDGNYITLPTKPRLTMCTSHI